MFQTTSESVLKRRPNTVPHFDLLQIGRCEKNDVYYLLVKLIINSIWQANWSTSNWLRFQAAAASPLLLMSALSNFCFFTDANVGYLLARKAVYDGISFNRVFFSKNVKHFNRRAALRLAGGIVRLMCILAVMYCCCHVSMALGRRNKRNAKLAHQDPNHEE